MLTPITPVAEELRREEAMGAIARAHAAGAEAGNWPSAPLIGGTALRIIHGVPRPSLDLDFVVLQPDRQLTRDELTVCAEQAGYRTVQCGLAENQQQRQLVIREPGWLGKKIRILVDETATQAHERKYLVAVLQGGILSYEPTDLFRLKTGALVTPPRPGLRPRVAARDVFDTAFIQERFPAALDDKRGLAKRFQRRRDHATGGLRQRVERAGTSYRPTTGPGEAASRTPANDRAPTTEFQLSGTAHPGSEADGDGSTARRHEAPAERRNRILTKTRRQR